MHRSLSLSRVLSAGLVALALSSVVPCTRAQTTAFNDTFTGGSTVNSNPTSPATPAVTAVAYQQLAAKTFSPNPPVITAGNLRFGIISTSSGFNHAQALFTNYPVTLVNNGDYIELTVNFSVEGGIITAQTNSTLFFGLYNAGQVQPIPGGMNGTVATATAGYAQTWQGYVNRIFYAGGSNGFYSRPAQTAVAANNQDLQFNYTGASAVGATSVSTLAAFTVNSPYTGVYRITKASATTLSLASSLYAGSTPTGTPLYTQSATSASTLTSVYDAFALGWRSTASVASTMNVSAVKITTTGTTTVIPQILTHPLSLTKMVGESVSLSVVADGGNGTALSYQWKKNGVDVSGATSATYDIASAALTDAGDYTVVVTDIAGSTTSAIATLTVSAGAVPPSIVTDPVGTTLLVGGSYTFSFAANGTAPLTYQWQKSSDNGANYADITGATATSYGIASATLADAGSYRVVVSNAQGSAASAAAALVVNAGPVITVQPVGAALNPGAALSLSVTATGSPAPSYQWKKNGVAIAGATAATYNVASVSGADTGGYTVVVSNSVGSVTSSAASVAILSATMAQTAVTPPTATTGLNPDTRLTITFNEAVTAGVSGFLRIYDASNDSVVDTIDLVAATALRDTLRAGGALSTQLLPVQTKPIGGIANNFNYYPVTVSGNTATIYPRNGVLAYNKTYYVKIEAGVFVNASGEAFAGVANNTTWTFSTKTAGPASGSASLTVAADGSGDFNTLQAALDFIPAGNTVPTTIRVKPGTYFEEIGFQSKHFVTILGDDIDQTVIAYPNNNTFNNVSGVYHRATLVAQSVHDFTLANVTITNTTPQNGTQAEAIVINGSSATTGRNLVTHCKFYSYQDTVQFNKQTYVSDSVIQGDVDFMWGDGPSFFENCDIRILRTGGYFTQIRNNSSNHGFVFHNCRFIAPAGITGTFFGRIDPAGFPFSEVAVLDSTVGDATNNSLLATVTGVNGSNYLGGWWLLNNVSNTSTATNVHNWANSLLDGNGTLLVNPNADTFTTMPVDAAVQANYRDVTWVLNTNISGTVNGSWTPTFTPVITSQPTSQSTAPGGAATFSVSVAAVPAATYQWQKDGTAIAGATSATYSIASVGVADLGTYTVVATNSAGTAISTGATLALSGLPTFTTQPVSQTVTVGANVTLTAAAIGAAPITYQWKKDGANLAGATAATLALANVQLSDAGSYTVVATNGSGSTTSDAATVIVNPAVIAPSITTQPNAVTVTAGNSASFTVVAAGTAPLTYQWSKDGVAIAGATATSYSIAAAQTADAGSYTVVVTNAAGFAASNAATLTVNAAINPAKLQDKFNDGSRTDLSPTTSAAWFTSATSSTVFTNGTGGANGTLALDNGSSRTMVGYFTAAGAPLSVGVGESLTLDIAFVIDGAALDKSGGLIVGLLRSDANPAAVTGTGFTANGSPNTNGRVSADFASSNPTSHVFGSYVGYAAWTNLLGTSNPVSFRKRIVTASPGTDGLDNASASWTQISPTGGTGSAPVTGTTFHALMKLTRGIDGSMVLVYKLTQGSSTLVTHTVTEAVATTTSFDTVNVYLASAALTGASAAHLTLQQVDVTLTSDSSVQAPAITTQPASQTVIAGSGATFNVAATGTPAPAYQWQKDTVDIAGATSATLALANVQAANAGSYRVIVTNTAGSVISSAATLTVQTPPVITTPPASQSVLAGADVTFDVSVSGTAPFSYQWKRIGTDLAGATSATLTLTGVTLTDTGDYTVVVTNVAGSTTSAAATLTVSAAAQPPVIVTQPASQTIALGSSASFTVAATGTAPLTYQWSKDGVALSGATSATLDFVSVTAADAGSYTVAVGNAAGNVTSDAATLTVILPPTIIAQPVGATADIGNTVTFTVGVTGTAPFSYQWKKNGAIISGATASSLTLTGIQSTDTGSYTVVVTNGVGFATSSSAILTINTPPSIVTQPAAQVAVAGSNVTFTVVATGTAPLTYQWSKDGSPVAGATSATLALTGVQAADAGSYTVTITNAFGTATSDTATLTLTAALANSAYNLTGFATAGTGTTGGGVIPESDPAYRKVYTPLDLAAAIVDSNKTAGAVKVIEVMNDLNLGWNEIGSAVQTLASTPFRAHAAPKLHPTLISSGVSVVDIKAKSGLTIFSANGATIKHVNFNIKGTSNIIIRNLKFDEMWEWDEATKGDYDSNDWDFITLSNGGAVTNVWVDHCTFTKAYDGITDFKAGTQYVTFSWCRYVGDDGATNPNSPVRIQIAALEANRSSYAFYNFLRTNGFSVEDIIAIQQGHDKGHLMGANSLDADNATLTATFHHQWFQNLWDRCVPRLRGGNVHDYNIYVDDVGVLAAKRLRDTRAAALTTALRNTLNNTYSFNPPINGSISTEGGALLLEKSVYSDCLWPLRNNQTDVNNPAYTGKILALDSIYSFHNTDGTTTLVRGNSTDAGNPMGPFQAAVIPFSWNLTGNQLPYTYTMDDPAQLPNILAIGAGAGKLTWSKDNWLKTSYVDDAVAPSIVTPPASRTVSAGVNVTFTVVAGGSGNSYQWQKAGVAIAGATGVSLTLNNVQAADAADYTVVVTNTVGSVTSDPATLIVTAAAPVIVTQPAAQSASFGGSASFTVIATGTAPLGYQWSKDGSVIAGATSATLSLSNLSAADAGSYAVVVSNSVDAVTSTTATLTVLIPPSITSQPASQSAAVGASVSFTVVASGTAPLAYQWAKDGATIVGQTSTTLTLNNVQATDTASYTVSVSNTAGSVTSAAATLTVSTAPVIVTPPVSQSVVIGADVTFTVVASGSGNSYQWQKDGSAIAGATSASLSQTNVQLAAAGSYTVTVSNTFGSVLSSAATLTVSALGAGDLYVAPDGLAANPGTLASPTTLGAAITLVPPGSTIWVRGGTYLYSTGVAIALGNNGTAASIKNISAYQNEVPVLDFSGQAVADSSRGLTVNGNYWHVKGLIVQHAGDNGIYIGGNNNVIERCTTAFNADSGLQLGRASSSFVTIAQWPSNNLILNCDSHDNKDVTNENADGFACKLTTGVGNVFRGCIAHHNIDDGWDLFTKADTGPIGIVTLDQCIAYNNGALSDGSSSGAGDKNGFKLGGTDIAVNHIVTRCIAFGNGKNGFTWNSNPGAIRMINNLAFDNVQGNYKFDQAGPLFYNNISHWTTGNGINDRYGGSSGIATGPSNVFWYASGTPKSKNDQGIILTNASFVSLTAPSGGFTRNDDGSIALGNFGRPINGSPLVNAGSLPDASVVAELPYVAASYYEGAPDIGVVETYLNAAPTITSQPANLTVTIGADATFSVAANGTAPFSFQWYKNNVLLAGATNATLTLSNVQLSAAGSYSVVVSNSLGNATSAAAALTVNPAIAPNITSEPAPQIVPEGASASFTVVATGSAPLTYQWFKDSNVIAGATTPTLMLSGVQLSDGGAYTVTVTNSAGSDTSAAATLTINTSAVAPVITTQPVSVSVVEGNVASFTVTATGTAPLSYQWSKNGSALRGATSATLMFASAQSGDAGSYTVTVSNAADAVTSNAALLSVTPATGATYVNDVFNDGSRTDLNPPSSAAWFSSSTGNTVLSNGTLALDNSSSRTLVGYFTVAGSPVSLGAGDTVTLDLIFNIDGAALVKSNGLLVGLLQSVANPSAVSGTGFTAPGARVTGDFASSNPTSHVFGNYTGYAAWTNLAGGASPVTWRKRIATASPGTDGLDNASASWTQIGSASGTGTAPATGTDFHAILTLTRTSTGGMNLNYVLSQGGSALVNYSASETVASYTTFDTINVYMASATLNGGAAAHLTLKQANVSLVPAAPLIVAPVITTQPVSQLVVAGNNVNFMVAATGTSPLSYQWSKDGTVLTGATSATLALSSITTSAAGNYTVTVSNPASSVVSNTAALTVNKAAASIALGNLSQTYDGTSKSVSATTTPTGLTVVFTYNGSQTAPTAAGNYDVSATIDDANYVGTTTATLNITKATAAITLGNLNQTYNGAAKSATVTSTPGGLVIALTYDGNATSPTNAGAYAVAATVNDANYVGTQTGTLTITQALASLTLGDLVQSYDGTPKSVIIATTPSGLAVTVTYNGSATPPTYPGTYAVVATVNDANYHAIAPATGMLTITSTALVRHAPTISGVVEGSVQVTSGENLTLSGSAMISGDLLVPGTPSVQVNGNALYAGTLDGPGSASPANYSVKLSGNALLRYLVRRTDPLALPTVTTPPIPTGTRSVTLTNASQSAGDFTTLRNLTLSGTAGFVTVPAGTYGNFVANGTSGFVLGVAGATEPAIYNLQNLSINPLLGAAQLKIVGPVIITVANGVSIFGATGSVEHPEWLVLRVSSGGLTLTGKITFNGNVLTPNGTVTLNKNSTINGSVIADRLSINDNGLLNDPEQ